MKSLLAVALQLFGSAVNYAVFIIVVRSADAATFVAFSTAVGLNMFAFALAEGGISYIAPREIEKHDAQGRARLSAVFLAVIVLLYAAALCVGLLTWNGLAEQALDTGWVLAYALYFSPMLLLPAWLTQLTMNGPALVAYALVRLALVGWLWMSPDLRTMIWLGVANLLLGITMLVWLDERGRLLRRFGVDDLHNARRAALGVVGMKTVSYAIYGALPMLLGILVGNATAAVFVAGERLKALYATAFRPLVQTLYLRACRIGSPPGVLWRRAGIPLLGLNLLVGGAIWLAFDPLIGLLFADNVPATAAMRLFLIAALLSVAGSILLFFLILPHDKYRAFAGALGLQAFVLVIATATIALTEPGATGLILVLGEAALLLALVVGWRRVG